MNIVNYFLAEEDVIHQINNAYEGVVPEIVIKEKKVSWIETHLSKSWNPRLALIAGLLFPGAGQLFKGNIGGGIAWFLLILTQIIIFPISGILFHMLAAMIAFFYPVDIPTVRRSTKK